MSGQREIVEQAVRRAEAVFVLIDPAYASRQRFVEVSKETAFCLVGTDAPGSSYGSFCDPVVSQLIAPDSV